MRFRVSEVKNAGRLQQDATEDPQLLFGQPQKFVYYDHPVSLTAQAVYSGAGVEVKGRAKTAVGFDCGRCNKRFEKEFDVPFEMIGSIDAVEVDATPEIKDAFLLEMPLMPVCAEDCKGLCPSCGTNLNLKTCKCPVKPEHLAWKTLDNIRFRK